MDSLKEIANHQQANFPRYFDDPSQDQWLRVMLGLCEEVCVLREREETRRFLLDKGEMATDQQIDEFVPSEELTAKRIARHQSFFEELFARLDTRAG